MKMIWDFPLAEVGVEEETLKDGSISVEANHTIFRANYHKANNILQLVSMHNNIRTLYPIWTGHDMSQSGREHPE